MDAVRLEVRVEELERRLRARSIELETELKAKERLRERVRELTSRVDDLQETVSALHREAASSTSLARELDETLKVAAEARVQLGAALEAERNRRLEVEVVLSATEAQADSARKRDEELAAARRHLSQLRQKTAGHEAHIESLRTELEQAHAARARGEDEQRRLQAIIEGLQKTFDERHADAEATLAQAVSAAEQIRREGVEAFEKSREAGILQEMEGERVQKVLAAGIGRLAAESEQLKAKAETLKQELRARADREVTELRLALDEERARLYADVEVEREARGKRVAPALGEDSARHGREVGEARRREISKELEGYLTPEHKTLPAAPAPAAQPAPQPKTEPPAAVALSSIFRWDEELRLLLYVAISVSLVAAVVAGLVLYQG